MHIESLGVLPALLVEVDGINDSARSDGLDPDSLKHDIEQMLRQARIPVLSKTDWQQTLGNPMLNLHVELIKPSQHFYIYSVLLEARQLVQLMLDSTRLAFAPTWSSGYVLGTVPTARLPRIRQQVIPLVRQFLADYRTGRRAVLMRLRRGKKTDE